MSTLLLYFMATTSKTLTSSTLVKERWSEIFLHFYKGAGAAARVARQVGGWKPAPDTLRQPRRHHSAGCTASIPSPSVRKSSGPHLLQPRERETVPFFCRRKKKSWGCWGARTGAFLWKPHLVFLFEAKSGLGGGRQVGKRCSRATIAPLMLLCLAASRSHLPPPAAMGHRRLDPPGFLPFVQTHPAGSWPGRTYGENDGRRRASSFVPSEAGNRI